MRRTPIALAAAGAGLVLAACAAAPAPVAFHQPAVKPAYLVSLAHHRSSGEYLVDGASLGSAASQKPSTPPDFGEPILQENQGAWKVCYNGTLYLCSATDWHMTYHNGDLYWDHLAAPGDQGVTLVPEVEWFYVKFSAGHYLCAGGGVGSADKITSLSGCSTYHEEWDFDTSPIKGGGKIIPLRTILRSDLALAG
jgi:hypothetical protein